MFNAVYFFSLIGLKNTFTANLIIYCVLLAGVLVSFYLVDKVGRRPLLLGGTAFMSLCVFVVGGLGFMTLTDAAGNALVAIMSLWVAAYAISIAPIGVSAVAFSGLFADAQDGCRLSSFPRRSSVRRPPVSPHSCNPVSTCYS